MAITYTELIEQLRSAAKIEQATCESEGIYESGHAKMLREAADAIETPNKGINAYADEAFKRAQELSYARERIDELDELCIVYCNERDRLKVQLDEVNEERAELRRRIEELVDKYAAEAECEPCEDCEQTPCDEAHPALHVLYICDRRRCDTCNPECNHTDDVRHAKNFEVQPCGGYIAEQED